MTLAPERRTRRWLTALAAVTIALAIGGPLLGRGLFLGADIIRTFAPWSGDTPSTFVYRHGPIDDTIDFYTPDRELIRHALVSEGRFPLWNPYPNGGTPLGSVPNDGLLSPLEWPMLILGVGTGAAWSGLLRLALAFVAARALARRLGLSELASSSAGLIYSMSGFIIAWANWPQANIAAWIPALFLVADSLRQRRRVIDLLGLAGVLAAMLLEGYPPLTVASLYAVGPFLLVRMFEDQPSGAAGTRSLWGRTKSGFARMGRGLRPAPWLLAGGVLGAALSAFQLIPFGFGLPFYNLDYRVTSTHKSLPAASSLTTMFPWALGSPASPSHLPSYPNFVDAFSFLGAAAIVLVLYALIRGRPAAVSAGVYRFFALGSGILFLPLFAGLYGDAVTIGGVIKDALYSLPLMGQVPLSRLRAPFLFFLTFLAAFGIEHLVQSHVAAPERQRRPWIRWVLSAFVVGFVLESAWRSIDSLLDSRERTWALHAAIPAAVIAIVTIVAVVVARRSSRRVRVAALAALPILFAVEALLVTTPSYARVSRSDYYPMTPTIRFLQHHLGRDRYASADEMLFPSAGSYYRLRAVNGHSFSPQTWREMVAAAADGVYSLPTLTLLGHGVKAATSPVLDQMAARYFVTAPENPVFGIHEPASVDGQAPPVRVGGRTVALGTIAGGPIRAVTVTVLGRTRMRGSLAYIDVTVRDDHGAIVGRGVRRFVRQDHTESYDIAVPGESTPASPGSSEVTVALRSKAKDSIRLAPAADGSPALGTIRPKDDGLRLAHVDTGAVIWRRLHALGRIRWASSSYVIKKDMARLIKLMLGGVAPNEVMLNEVAGPAEGQPATVHVRRDDPDRIEVGVDAKGAGYVVIADAIQHGWVATVDGTKVPVRAVDHGLAGVRVLAGHHVVTLYAKPRAWYVGIAVSALAVLGGLALGAMAWWSSRRRRRRTLPS
ncbi:MAG: DUF7657 domain-containing protein [Acidimicrobiia bacterium]